MDIYELARKLDGHMANDLDKMLDLPNEELSEKGICVAYILPDLNLYISGSDNLIIPVEVKDVKVMEQINVEVTETGTGLTAQIIENTSQEFDSPFEVDADAFFYDQTEGDFVEVSSSSPDYKEHVIYLQYNNTDIGRRWTIGSRFSSVTFQTKLGALDWCTGIVFDKKEIMQ